MGNPTNALRGCELFGHCGGCDRWHESGIPAKVTQLQRALGRASAIEYVTAGPWGFRDKLDFALEQGALGLLNKDGAFVAIEDCPLLSPALRDWYRDFRRLIPPRAEKISVRLRVSPTGERGAWLRLGHVATKAWLEEAGWWRELCQRGVLEVGERLKRVTPEMKLAKHPSILPWFETYVGEELSPTPLFGHVGSFTQVGFAANRLLIQAVQDLLPTTVGRAIELFAGLGNFTLPLASWGWQVEAFELHPTTRACLETSLAEHAWKSRVRFSIGNMYGGALPDMSGAELVLVDPPRSGLGSSLAGITSARPAQLLYVSCDSTSFLSDAAALTTAGYRLERIRGVDQFPHTSRMEWVARFSL
jgi:23S rRNA (uracil1939-C5)-methyltransferase